MAAVNGKLVLDSMKYLPRNRFRKAKGFRGANRFRKANGIALVELVIVITIVAMIAGSALYLVVGSVEDAKYQRVDTQLQALDLALRSYERNNYFKPPTQEQGLRALYERPISDPQPERWQAYLNEPMLDPWGQEFQYACPAKKSSKKYDIYSLGEDGVVSDDDVGNW